VIMCLGIRSLSYAAKVIPVIYILIGAVGFYVILLVFTKIVFQRDVTSELLLITIWAAIESSAIAVLLGVGCFGVGRAWTMAAVMILATLVGIVCYVLYYRLEGMARFWDGLIPLMVDAVAVATFLVMLALPSVQRFGL
jgi:hypothetical protein